MNYFAPDLTIHPPRSPRVLLGGFAILARTLDKCRASLVGKNGDYHYDCPLDQRVFAFAGITAEGLKAEVAAGKTDGEIVEWIHAHSTTKPEAYEISLWSQAEALRGPTNTDSRGYFNGLHEKYGPKREDISSWFDLLDLDDYVSYGGKA
jgi:hypothetical protein